MKLPHQYSEAERLAIYRVIAERRDMRHFTSALVPEEILQRVLHAAHQAPSVGLMQPWRFIRITSADLRGKIHALVEAERQLTAKAMGGRDEEFLKLKVEGVRECAELLVVVLAPDDGTIFGRRTLPEMNLASVACAVQNLWLAARAEGLGMGWVSLFDPAALASLLDVPDGGKPVAILCLGQVDEFYALPMLQLEGWRNPKPLSELLFENGWESSS